MTENVGCQNHLLRKALLAAHKTVSVVPPAFSHRNFRNELKNSSYSSLFDFEFINT
jgi:hypothetical protein